jgi:hypothetical protein
LTNPNNWGEAIHESNYSQEYFKLFFIFHNSDRSKWLHLPLTPIGDTMSPLNATFSGKMAIATDD